MVQESNMKFIYFVLFTLFISGCSIKQESIEMNNYAIDFKLPQTTFKTQSGSILIKEPTINSSFANKRIIYSLKPYSFESYAKNQWVDYPSSMLHQKLHDSIEKSTLFQHTLLKANALSSYTLQTHIGQLYHDFQDKHSYAVVNIKFELFKQQTLKKTFTYQKKIVCKQNNAYGFVKAVNEALKEVSVDLVEQLHNATAL